MSGCGRSRWAARGRLPVVLAAMAGGPLVGCIGDAPPPPFGGSRAMELNAEGVSLIRSGDTEQALAVFEQALALAQRLDEPVAQGEALQNGAVLARLAGRMDEAIRLQRMAVERYGLVSEEVRVAEARLDLSILLAASGDTEAAAAARAQAADVLRASGTPAQRARLLLIEASEAAEAGRFADAVDRAGRGLEQAGTVPAADAQADALALVAGLHAARAAARAGLGAHAAAAADWQAALELDRRREASGAIRDDLRGLARARRALGDAAAADRLERRAELVREAMGAD